MEGIGGGIFEFMIILNRETSTYGIEFTGEVGRKLSFLDVMLEIQQMEDGTLAIATSLYKKPTDNRSFLQRSSFHPAHVFKSVPHSQLLRAKTICSDETAFEKAAD